MRCGGTVKCFVTVIVWIKRKFMAGIFIPVVVASMSFFANIRKINDTATAILQAD